MKAQRVLIAGDDTVIATLLAELLVKLGHCICAIEATEAEAVSAACRCRPDLIIADMCLREGDGVSALETILCSCFVPHILVGNDIRGLQARMPNAVILRKPFLEAVLVNGIARALGRTAASF